ncbi:antibiotic biosynthesis monooxygenase [Nakamurella silvestris]|nr:antibiotic biosynthesis monooxygenase [Nakamurella silvestris]
MSVVVVATITPVPGRAQDVVDAFVAVTPAVHAEAGCELYAIHTDGEVVVMVERWTSQEDLDRHSAGAALVEFKSLTAGALATSPTVLTLQNVPAGQPAKGTISSSGGIQGR